ncbi:MAG: hypothetical protein Q3X60_08705, partial [Alistipes sp.]|uniref:hypothetical protein n=1 Tax=Alistipes sp. TaxID=1872444 RepID=UPI00284BB8D3
VKIEEIKDWFCECRRTYEQAFVFKYTKKNDMTHRIFDFLMSFTKKHTNSGVCTACLPTDTALCGNKARAPQIGRNKIRMLRYKTAPGSIFL